MREICLDTETTGLDPREGHRVIEVACVEMINRVKTGNVFHSYINPRREVPFEAFKIHGISTEFLQDKPIFNHVAYKFLDFIRGAKLVIHNAAFDMKFLNFELGLIGIEPLSGVDIIDSLILARSKFPGAQNSLDALCKRFGVDLSKRKKHGALLDSELLADVYIEMMGGAQEGLVFESNIQSKNIVQNVVVAGDSANNSIQNNEAKKIIPSRRFSISEDELSLHKEFIKKNFKENLWGY